MEDVRGIKSERSPSAEGSPLSDDTKTPPPAPSGSPPPPGSPSVVSSRNPCSPVFVQGNASGKTPMIDPSSFIVDTSRDEELARKLFGDLNRDILRPPGDGKIIILDDSDNDDKAQEEKTTGIESMAAPASTDDVQRQRSIIVMIRGPTRRPMVVMTADAALTIVRLSSREQGVAAGVL
jgi:hypothetical protein